MRRMRITNPGAVPSPRRGRRYAALAEPRGVALPPSSYLTRARSARASEIGLKTNLNVPCGCAR